MRIKPVGKLVILIIVAGILFGGYRLSQRMGLLDKIAPPAVVKESKEVPKADLPDINTPPTTTNGTTTTPVSTQLPGSEPGCTNLPEVRLLHWAWNAHMGAMLATGGPQASEGSLMCKYGVNLKLTRQDDAVKMQEALVAFATELSQGVKHPKKGAHFVTIMGDGGAAFLKGLNDTLRRLGPEYKAKVIGSCGYSRGEDKFMGLPEWKANPASSRGGVVSGYLRDGDWNIAMKWLGDNGLKNNPDEKTYDPDALNWVAANDYIDAAEKYIAGYTETRPVVRNGRRTGQTKKITVNGVVTWTPGDVSIAQKKGGLVSIVSTKEYSSQMPNIIIGIDKWMKANRPMVEGMLRAVVEGGDRVKRDPGALRQASRISAVVYNEEGADAAYWEKYFKGVTEQDAQGLDVELGGSSVNNLADNLLTFGLVTGSANLFAATYKVFGDIVVDQYPELVPNYPPIDEILDTSYLRNLARKMAPAASTTAIASARPRYPTKPKVQTVVSRKAWNIRFQTGKADFTPQASQQLQKLLRDLLVAGGTVVEIHGHTDAVGNPQTNMALSEARAFSVKKWLEKKSPVNFPPGRVRVYAHGQQNPVAPNSSEQGRSQNRRVEIVLGTTGTGA